MDGIRQGCWSDNAPRYLGEPNFASGVTNVIPQSLPYRGDLDLWDFFLITHVLNQIMDQGEIVVNRVANLDMSFVAAELQVSRNRRRNSLGDFKSLKADRDRIRAKNLVEWKPEKPKRAFMDIEHDGRYWKAST